MKKLEMMFDEPMLCCHCRYLHSAL